MKNNKNIIITVVLVVVAGIVGFFGGMKYQQSKRSTFSGQFGNMQGSNGTGRQQSGNNTTGQQNGTKTRGGQVMGEIIGQDDKSITVKLQDGSSKIVLINDKTTINKADIATKDDLKNGEKVAVFGTSNTDNSVTAQAIQLNPKLQGAADGGPPGQ